MRKRSNLKRKRTKLSSRRGAVRYPSSGRQGRKRSLRKSYRIRRYRAAADIAPIVQDFMHSTARIHAILEQVSEGKMRVKVLHVTTGDDGKLNQDMTDDFRHYMDYIPSGVYDIELPIDDFTSRFKTKIRDYIESKYSTHEWNIEESTYSRPGILLNVWFHVKPKVPLQKMFDSLSLDKHAESTA